MGTDKRERKKANRNAKLEAERAAERRARRIQTIRNAVIAGVAIVAVMVLITVLSGCGSESEGGTDGGGSSDTTAAPVDGYGSGECPPEEGVEEPVVRFDDAPQQCIDPARAYTATVVTTEGTVVVELDTERTPLTTNNFVTLARYGFYDGTDLFRTEAPTGIIQGGSPITQDNSDPGPGYDIPDEALPFTSDDYGAGTLAMARSAQPDSAGGQFFFLASEGGRYLGDPNQLGESAGTYVAFGTVVEGLEVLQAIAALDDGTGAPSKQVTIESIEITES